MLVSFFNDGMIRFCQWRHFASTCLQSQPLISLIFNKTTKCALCQGLQYQIQYSSIIHLIKEPLINCSFVILLFWSRIAFVSRTRMDAFWLLAFTALNTVSSWLSHAIFSNQSCEDWSYTDKSTRFACISLICVSIYFSFCKRWKLGD